VFIHSLFVQTRQSPLTISSHPDHLPKTNPPQTEASTSRVTSGSNDWMLIWPSPGETAIALWASSIKPSLRKPPGSGRARPSVNNHTISEEWGLGLPRREGNNVHRVISPAPCGDLLRIDTRGAQYLLYLQLKMIGKPDNTRKRHRPRAEFPICRTDYAVILFRTTVPFVFHFFIASSLNTCRYTPLISFYNDHLLK
jgi:hypothetical protein